MELLLQGLWMEVLNVTTTTHERDFFQLGGDSVTAIHLVSKARRKGLLLSVDKIFRYPTLSEMARAIRPLMPDMVHKTSEQGPDPGPCVVDTQRLRVEAANQCCVKIEQIERIYPCTPSQTGMMALTMKVHGAYVMQSVSLLPSYVDLSRFKCAWASVVAANAILRTRFVQPATSDMIQAILADQFIWVDVDVPSAQVYTQEDRKKGMLIGDPLTRFAIMRDGRIGKRYFVCTIHHSLLDAWSFQKLVLQVEHAYNSISYDPGVTFETFVRYVATLDRKSAEDFWQGYLLDSTPQVFPKLPSKNYQPLASARVECEASVLWKQNSRITKATVLQAAWSLLMARYSLTQDVVFGITLSGRNAPFPAIEEIIGPTITTVPFRISFDTGQTIENFLKTVQDLSARVIEFEQLGLTRIQALSQDAHSACEFRNLLLIQPYDKANESTASPFRFIKDNITVPLTYALTMECILNATGVVFRASFDENVIDMAQMNRLVRQFNNVLSQLATADAMKQIKDIKILSPSDLEEIHKWNQLVHNCTHACIHDQIQQRAQRQPHSAAVFSWDGQLTYEQLLSRSGQLASHLKSLGVRTGAFIPICYEKSVWAVVSMLAVMMAGAACVPLDPGYPALRRETILESVAARWVITSPQQAHLFKKFKFRVIIISAPFFAERPSLTAPLGVRVSPNDPSYAIYTSGSTGTPKGIVIEHASLCSSVKAHSVLLRLTHSSRVFQFAAFVFDISFSDIFATLVYGGCICMPSEYDRLNDLAGSVRNLKANQVCLTTTVASQLRPEEVRSLKVLALCGEAVTQAVVTLWVNELHLINMYGPAECTIYCAGTSVVDEYQQPNKIGTGIGALTWITDPDDFQSLAPIGTVGELLIQGPVLGRGYLGDEGITRAAFIESPAWLNHYQLASGKRVYRTGDLVRYNSDGTIEFIGRKDTQIKLRGQRIELSEIEHRIRTFLPSKFRVAVEAVMLQNQHTDTVLVAFVCTDAGSRDCTEPETFVAGAHAIPEFKNAVEGLKIHVADSLPRYMVPKYYVPLNTLPISASAKIDRKRLRKMVSQLSIRQLTEFSNIRFEKHPPCTKSEVQMHALWVKVLRSDSEEIGTEDNFFQLGGDSVVAMRLVAAARDVGMRLTVETIFNHPRLWDLALQARPPVEDHYAEIAPFALIGSSYAAEKLCEQVCVLCRTTRDQIEDVFPCTPCQEFYMDFTSHYGDPAEGPLGAAVRRIYSLPPDIDLIRFQVAWETVLAAHAILRTRIVRLPDGCFQTVLRELPRWSKAKSLNEYVSQDEEVELSFGGPLCRFAIVSEIGRNALYFVWTAQHAIFDGWSVPLIMAELEQAYQTSSGRDSFQPTQFNRFIQYQTEMNRESSEQYWRSYLNGVRCKPFHRSTKPYGYQSNGNHNLHVTLSHTVNADVTLANAVYGAWAIVIRRLTASEDVMLELTLTGRDLPVGGIEQIGAPTVTRVSTQSEGGRRAESF